MGTTCEDGAEVGTGFSRQLTPLEAESGAWARVHENDMSLGHFVRTSERLFAPLARLARMASDDVLLDLGSGDGVMLATLAEQTGCCGIGVEVNPILCKKAERLRESLGFASWRLQYLCMQAEQLRLEDLNKVTIVYVYLLRVAENEVVMRLLQQLLRRGVRIVSSTFILPEKHFPPPSRTWPDEDTVEGLMEVMGRAGGAIHSNGTFYMYEVTSEDTSSTDALGSPPS